jgi:hypothetical protein
MTSVQRPIFDNDEAMVLKHAGEICRCKPGLFRPCAKCRKASGGALAKRYAAIEKMLKNGLVFWGVSNELRLTDKGRKAADSVGVRHV